MQGFAKELKTKFAEELSSAALEYIDLGRDLFHRHISSERDCMQSAIGTLGTGTELLLKSYIATHNLGAIFKDVPPEMRVFLSSLERVPQFFEWHNYAVNIRTEKYVTLDLKESVAGFFIFFPHMKQPMLPHINALIKRSDACLHSVLPSLNMYEFERIGYAVINIIRALGHDKSFEASWLSLSEDDLAYMKRFEKNRHDRVRLAVLKAKKSSSKREHDHFDTVYAHDWNHHVAVCPVCRSQGLMEGYTVLAVGQDEDGFSSNLDFFATTYHCDECGLTLNDSEEMKLVKLDTIYDRSSELDRWFAEHEDFSDWYLNGSM